MANSGKKATGVVLSIIVIIAIMAVKFVGINTVVHYLKFWWKYCLTIPQSGAILQKKSSFFILAKRVFLNEN